MYFRFNAYFAKELLKYQPISENAKVTKNSMRYRGIEGFIAAVSPFNFTAIGGNLAYTPALMVRKKKIIKINQWCSTKKKCNKTFFFLFFILSEQINL